MYLKVVGAVHRRRTLFKSAKEAPLGTRNKGCNRHLSWSQDVYWSPQIFEYLFHEKHGGHQDSKLLQSISPMEDHPQVAITTEV
jgi:hypothetical protein